MNTTPQADLPTARALRRRAERQRNFRLMTLWVLCPTAAAAFYWIAIAPPQYRSATEITIRGPQAPQTNILTGLGLGGMAGTSADPRLVVDYLQSPATIDMLRAKYGFKEAYSRFSLDPTAYLSPRAPIERASEYWRHKLKVDYDSSANTIIMSVDAFSPADALRLTQGVLAASRAMEDHLNVEVQLASLQLANAQLAAAKRDYDAATVRLSRLQGSQNVLPMDTDAKESEALIVQIDPQLAQLRVNLAAQQAAYKADAPQVISTMAQIATLEEERARAVAKAKAAPGGGAATHDVLTQAALLDYQFFQKSYYSAAAAVVAAQPEHANQSFVVSFVPPRLPERSNYWRRLVNIVAVFLAACMLFGIGSLSYSVIKDHVQ